MISEKDYPVSEEEGMAVYEYIVDNCESCTLDREETIARLKAADTTGQFLASTARYLHAVDSERFAEWLAPLIEGAIEKDRDRKYIGSLLEAIWGPEYRDRSEEIASTDDNFRRIYKRIYLGSSM